MYYFISKVKVMEPSKAKEKLDVTKLPDKFINFYSSSIIIDKLKMLDFDGFMKMNGYEPIAGEEGDLHIAIQTVDGVAEVLKEKIERYKKLLEDYKHYVLFNLDALEKRYTIMKVLIDNENKKVYYFSIGFENTTLYFPHETKRRFLMGYEFLYGNEIELEKPIHYSDNIIWNNEQLDKYPDIKSIMGVIDFTKEILIVKETSNTKKEI